MIHEDFAEACGIHDTVCICTVDVCAGACCVFTYGQMACGSVECADSLALIYLALVHAVRMSNHPYHKVYPKVLGGSSMLNM